MEDIREEKSAEDQETFLQKSPIETPNRSDNSKRIMIPTNLSDYDEDENQAQ